MYRDREGARRRAAAGTLLLVLAVACSAGRSRTEGRVRVVAAFYPLAWAARGVGGAAVEVVDLTPAGAEPHDLQLTARRRADVQDASLVLVLGKGFQPEVERAARDARGRVVDVLDGLSLLRSSREGLDADPHVWLDPVLMRAVVASVTRALAGVDRGNAREYERRSAEVGETLAALDASYRLSLGRCALKTLVTTHEAFGYLAAQYGLTVLALTGLAPEAEPAAAQIQRVREAAGRGQVGAVFYESTGEGRRIGRSVASDVGVEALPLHTLESDPAPGDYLSQMRSNLDNLVKGLRCA